MDITPYVDTVRADLVTLAGASGAEVRVAAERIAAALDPSLRMALIAALTDAAAEITTRVPSGSVEVRLRGRELDFVVDVPPPPPEQPYEAPLAVGEEEADDGEDGDIVRITLRLPEGVKLRAEELAARTGRSLNAWIVTALRSATRSEGWTIDLSQVASEFARGATGKRRPDGWATHVSGWL